MLLFPCWALMRQKILMQDEREQLERFTNSVKYLMVVESMKENDATAEVPGSGTWGPLSFETKRIDRLFAFTARAASA